VRLPAAGQSAMVAPLRGSAMPGLTMPLWGQQLLLIMCGGALGAAGRHWMSGFLLRRLGDGVPWGTLAVNLVGSFAVGFLAIWLPGRGPRGLCWGGCPFFVGG